MSNLPDNIRLCCVDQLDQSPSTCPVPVGKEERDHARYEIPADAETAISYAQTGHLLKGPYQLWMSEGIG